MELRHLEMFDGGPSLGKVCGEMQGDSKRESSQRAGGEGQDCHPGQNPSKHSRQKREFTLNYIYLKMPTLKENRKKPH